MTTVDKENQKAIFEANVSKVAKAMVAVVKDAKRYPDLLDEHSLAKLERFMAARTGDMIRGLVLARAMKEDKAAFSLDAEPEPLIDEMRIKMGHVDARTGVHHPQPDLVLKVSRAPSIPQVREEDEAEIMDNSPEDDDLDAIVGELEAAPQRPTTSVFPPATFEVAPPPPPSPTEAPKKWRPPTGRLVGTKEPVWIHTEDGKDKEDPGEQPDRNGYIREAGFLDAE